MKFKPVTDRYKFDNALLVRDYPEYLIVPVAKWIQTVLVDADILYWANRGVRRSHLLKDDFLTSLNVQFRENFPTDPKEFVPFIFLDPIRTTEILAVCLQNYAKRAHALELEYVLSNGGSAYRVFEEREPNGSYDVGFCTLVERVPEVVSDLAAEALKAEVQLKDAWISCYSHHPDYEKTVSRCCDVAEKLLQQHYFSTDTKPQITKFVYGLREAPEKLRYKGVGLHDNPQYLTDLAEKFSNIRGQHTAGTGRVPSKEEAEFVLHYTIFLWNMHN